MRMRIIALAIFAVLSLPGCAGCDGQNPLKTIDELRHEYEPPPRKVAPKLRLRPGFDANAR